VAAGGAALAAAAPTPESKAASGNPAQMDRLKNETMTTPTTKGTP